MAGFGLAEISGLRWRDVGFPVARWPTGLPLSGDLFGAFKAARRIPAADQLRLGEAYDASGYVVVNEAGRALTPNAIENRWARMLKAAGVRHVRLHDARHTCGTLVHLRGVPTALISAWLGHASKAFTLQTYVNPKPEARASSHAVA